MATNKQKIAAKNNIKRAQQRWREMTPRQHSMSQPQGRMRAKPGTTGEGEYYRIVVRPKEEFTTFRYHDVGDKGHLQRLAGKRSSGSWDTQSWLISKNDAHLEGDTLVADSADARNLIERLGSKFMHKVGDIFEARDTPNIPERNKPTEAQKRAWMANIKKAQAARWKGKTKSS